MVLPTKKGIFKTGKNEGKGTTYQTEGKKKSHENCTVRDRLPEWFCRAKRRWGSKKVVGFSRGTEGKNLRNMP